jgi:transposase
MPRDISGAELTDSHPIHRSKKVKEWFEKNKNKIEIFYLPYYSP